MPTNYSNGYWTEGKIVNGTNVGGGTFVPYTAANPASTPTPTPTPTPITTTPARTPSLLSSAQDAATIAATSRANAQVQADAYAATQRQARIDAINTTFAPRIAAQETANTGNLSRVAALNLKSGIVGSGVDTTNTAEQKGLNDKALQAIQDQKAMAINEAFGWADELATKRADQIYEDAKTGANANVEKYQGMVDDAKKTLDVFGSQGYTAEQVKSSDPKVYETLRDVAGMSDEEIKSYLAYKAPEGTYQWSAAQINGSTLLVPGIDPKTKLPTLTKLDMGYTPTEEKNIEVSKVDSGIWLIDKVAGTAKLIPGTGKSPSDSGFTLGEGQTRYDAMGNKIASSPTAPVGELTPADKSKGVTYLLNIGGTQADLDKFASDRAFQAWIIDQASK